MISLRTPILLAVGLTISFLGYDLRCLELR